MHRSRLEQRARYYGWLFVSSRGYVAVYAALMAASGVLQFLLGGDQFLQRYALLYQAPDAEWWRIITGSLIHAGPAHWLANLAMGIGIAALSGPSLQRYFLPVFLVSGWFAFGAELVQQACMPQQNYDALVGTSGEIGRAHV